jgi:hypothetical protein
LIKTSSDRKGCDPGASDLLQCDGTLIIAPARTKLLQVPRTHIPAVRRSAGLQLLDRQIAQLRFRIVPRGSSG